MDADALDLLRSTHSQLGSLLFDLTAAAPRERRHMLRVFGTRLRCHLHAEEEVLDPFYRRVVAEHDGIPVATTVGRAWVLEALDATEGTPPETAAFEEHLQRLAERLVAHAERQERTVFPFLKLRGGQERLRELAGRVEHAQADYAYELTGFAASMDLAPTVA